MSLDVSRYILILYNAISLSCRKYTHATSPLIIFKERHIFKGIIKASELIDSSERKFEISFEVYLLYLVNFQHDNEYNRY